MTLVDVNVFTSVGGVVELPGSTDALVKDGCLIVGRRRNGVDGYISFPLSQVLMWEAFPNFPDAAQVSGRDQ